MRKVPKKKFLRDFFVLPVEKSCDNEFWSVKRGAVLSGNVRRPGPVPRFSDLEVIALSISFRVSLYRHCTLQYLQSKERGNWQDPMFFAHCFL